MGEDQGERIARLETRLEAMEARFAAVEAKLDYLCQVLQMGKGAKQVLFWLGSSVLAIGALRPWEWSIWGGR